MIQKYYEKLKNVYLKLQSHSHSYPVVGVNDFTSFAQKTNILDKNLNLATLDRVFIATNVSFNGIKNSAERELHRYEFMEIVIRLAIQKYKETKICKTLVEASGKFHFFFLTTIK